MNTTIFYLFNDLTIKYPALNPVFAFLANNFGFVVICFLAVYIFTHNNRKKGIQEVLMIIIVAAVAWFFAHFLKNIFHTPRPFIKLDDVVQLLPHEADGAFPSGHATFYSALAMMMWFYHKRIGITLGIVAFIIGISRIIAGVHWPVDILGGYILGAAVSIVVYFLYKKYFFSLF